MKYCTQFRLTDSTNR